MIDQISIFDLLKEKESRFTDECRRGSGYEGGRVRIYCASCHLGVKEFAGFLKEEYGSYYGHSTTFPDGVRGFADYSGKGMKLSEFRSGWQEMHTWLEMAVEIKRLIFSDKYLSDKDREKVKEVTERLGGLNGLYGADLPKPEPRYGWAVTE